MATPSSMDVEDANATDIIKCDPDTYGAQVQKFLKTLYGNKLFSDVALSLDGEQIPAHKIILGVQSPLFKSQLKEDTKSLDVKTDKADKRIYKAMIQYMYTGTLDKLKDEDVLQLLAVADDYKVNPLKNQCGELLADGSSQDNVAYLLDIAEKFSCQSLKNRCGRFMAENFSDLLDSHKLMSLDPDIWKGIVMSPIVKVRSEEHLLDAIIKYAGQFPAAKEKSVFELLLPHIHFIRMRTEFLAKNVETNPKIKDISIVHQRLYEAFRYRALPEKEKKDAKLPRRKYDVCFDGSTVLSPDQAQQLADWTDNKEWTLVYKGTRDGFDAGSFHKLCNNVGPTLTLVESSNGHLFGGYTPIQWTGGSGYVYDARSFLFSLTNPNGTEPIKLKNDGPHHSNQYSIYDNSGYGPTFGGGHDLYIVSNANTNGTSYTNLGHSYTCPGYTYGQTNIKNFFCGSYNFLVKEVEVFKLID